MPNPVARVWFGVAALAGLLSLGLPWRNSVELGFGFTYYTSGLCYNSYDYDGWMTTHCDPWYVPNLEVKPTTALAIGAEHPVRVMLVLTVIALIVGYRRGVRSLLLAAPVIAAFGLFGYGVTGKPGQLAFAIGLAALLVALRRDGVLGRDRVLGRG